MSTEEQLHQALWSYHAAVQRREGVEARLRRGELDQDLYDRSLGAAEAVTAARVALYRVLMAQGWTPPDTVVADIAFDDALLRQQSV